MAAMRRYGICEAANKALVRKKLTINREINHV
jgi:hypothetical protein